MELKNKKGIYFKGKIVDDNEGTTIIGDFHYSKQYITLICSIFLLLFIGEIIFVSKEFLNLMIVNISIFVFI